MRSKIEARRDGSVLRGAVRRSVQRFAVFELPDDLQTRVVLRVQAEIANDFRTNFIENAIRRRAG